MAIEAPISKFKKTNLKIFIVLCLVATVWFGYDGRYNENFKNENTDANGKPNSTLIFNQKSPLFFFAGAVILGVCLFLIKDKKIVAEENGFVKGKETIAYDSIEKIDKTNFKSKGYFVITYKSQQGSESHVKIRDKTYDNLPALLEHLIAKIS